MGGLLDKIKKYINNIAYNDSGDLDDLDKDLDKIIKREYKKAFEIRDKYIGDIKIEYEMDDKIPELEILKYEPSIIVKYSPFENKISLSKEAIKRMINRQLKFLGYTEAKGKKIDYLNMSYNSVFLHPFYINRKDIRKDIAEAIISLAIFEGIWYSIDYSILDKLEKDPTIKDRDYLLTILKDHENLELRASAFGVIMYYLVNGFYYLKGGARALFHNIFISEAYRAVYDNILTCRKYIEEINMLENYGYKNVGSPYELGFCYGNIIVAKYRSSLKENIQDIIKYIIHLDKKRAIDEIKLYGDNLEWLSHD